MNVIYSIAKDGSAVKMYAPLHGKERYGHAKMILGEKELVVRMDDRIFDSRGAVFGDVFGPEYGFAIGSYVDAKAGEPHILRLVNDSRMEDAWLSIFGKIAGVEGSGLNRLAHSRDIDKKEVFE